MAWAKDPNFDVSSWTSVTLPDSPNFLFGDEFYRGRFHLSAPDSGIKAFIRCDDGCDLYLDGAPLGCFGNGCCHALGCVNFPGCGTPGFNDCRPPFSLGSLVAGDHVLAVHVSNGAGGFRLDANVFRGDPGTCGDCSSVGEECDPTAPLGACSSDVCGIPGTPSACTCPAATVQVSIRDQNGEPVVPATFQLYELQPGVTNSTLLQETITNNSYQVFNVPAGEYEVHVISPSFGVVSTVSSGPFTIAFGQTIFLDLHF